MIGISTQKISCVKWSKMDEKTIEITARGYRFRIQKGGIAAAIERVKKQRKFYETEKEYQERLNMYETALRMLA
jgi:hypothetical protein